MTVDPEPPPAPVEPDTVTVRDAARGLLDAWDHGSDWEMAKAWSTLRAALAAEGDRR